MEGPIYFAGLSGEKILMGGTAFPVNANSMTILRRLNADGSPDSSFQPVSLKTGAVYSITELYSGDLVVAGFFRTENDQPKRGLTVVRESGELSADFVLTDLVGWDYTFSELLPDGRFVVGGGRRFAAVYSNGGPRLQITSSSADQHLLSWPAAARDFVVEKSAALPAEQWSAFPGQRTIVGHRAVLTNSTMSAPQTVYRLRSH